MFDLIIYCVEQHESSNDLPDGNIFVEVGPQYCDSWKFMTTQRGVWYNLYTSEYEFAGTAICEHLGYDTTISLPELDYDVAENITPYKLSEKYVDSFRKIMEYLLQESPIKMLYVLARYQSPDIEVVKGTYTIDKFMSLLENGDMYANVCYIVTGHPKAIDINTNTKETVLFFEHTRKNTGDGSLC